MRGYGGVVWAAGSSWDSIASLTPGAIGVTRSYSLQGAVDARWVVISCFLLFGVVVVVAQLSSCLRVLVAVAFWLSLLLAHVARSFCTRFHGASLHRVAD